MITSAMIFSTYCQDFVQRVTIAVSVI